MEEVYIARVAKAGQVNRNRFKIPEGKLEEAFQKHGSSVPIIPYPQPATCLSDFSYVNNDDTVGRVIGIEDEQYRCDVDKEKIGQIDLSQYVLAANIITNCHKEDNITVVDDICQIISFSLEKKEN